MAGRHHLPRPAAVSVALVAGAALLALAAGSASATHSVNETNLALTELDLDPREPDPGDNVTFAAEVLNEGNETLENVTVEFTLDNETNERVILPELEPDNRTWVEGDPWEAVEGEHRLEAEVDPGDDVNETNETDNALSQTFEVASQPDLVAEDLEVDDPPLHGDEDASFTALVDNEGEGDAGNFTVELWVEDHGLVASQRVPGIPGDEDGCDGCYETLPDNSSAYVDLDVNGTLDVGLRDARVVVDADDEVDESDETDNELLTWVPVLPPEPADLAVATLEVERERIRTADVEGPANPVAGQEITYEIANQGDGRTISYAYAFVTVCPEDPDVPAPPNPSRCDYVDVLYVPPLDPGESVTEEVEWDTFGKAGDWTVEVDVYYSYEEASTDNNERSRETFVAVGGTGAGGVDTADVLHNPPIPPVDRPLDPVKYLLHDVLDQVDDAAEAVEPRPGAAPTTHEAGHYAVDYGEATYWNAQHMLQDEEERERDGPSHAWLDETQRGADMALGPTGEEARYPDEAPFVGGESTVNGSHGTEFRETFVWGIPYGYADVLGVTAITDAAVRITLEETQFSGLQEKSPNDRMREDVFPASHVLVNETAPQLP